LQAEVDPLTWERSRNIHVTEVETVTMELTLISASTLTDFVAF
jgi:hypothetical protein